jgi:hypothetical protein
LLILWWQFFCTRGYGFRMGHFILTHSFCAFSTEP